jgi:hypothetical protein
VQLIETVRMAIGTANRVVARPQGTQRAVQTLEIDAVRDLVEAIQAA